MQITWSPGLQQVDTSVVACSTLQAGGWLSYVNIYPRTLDDQHG